MNNCGKRHGPKLKLAAITSRMTYFALSLCFTVVEATVKIHRFKGATIPSNAFTLAKSWDSPSSGVCAATALKYDYYFHSYDKTNGICEVGSADITDKGSGNKKVMYKGWFHVA